MVKRKIGLLKKLLRTCWFTVPLVIAISSSVLYFLRDTTIPALYITTLTAWLASDALVFLFLQGGNGILQIPIFGNKTTFKSYGFVFFFIAIFSISIGINFLNDKLVKALSAYLSIWYLDVGLSIFLSLLVLADLNVKYYNHDKKDSRT